MPFIFHCQCYSMNSLFKQSQRYRVQLDVSGSTTEVQSDVGTPSDVLVSPLFCFQCQQTLSTLPHFFPSRVIVVGVNSTI